MTRIISKIGNSQGLMFDVELRKLTRLKVGELVNVEIHRDDKISITPLQISLHRSRSKAKRTVAH